METDDPINLLLNRPSDDIDALAPDLNAVATHLHAHAVQPTRATTLAAALVDRVAPLLASISSPAAAAEAEAAFHAAIARLPPPLIFTFLHDSLRAAAATATRNTDGPISSIGAAAAAAASASAHTASVLAGALAHVVASSRRVAALLPAVDDARIPVAAVLHLPSRLANAHGLLQAADSMPSPPQSPFECVDEAAYYARVAAALAGYQGNGVACSRPLRTLLSALVLHGHASVVLTASPRLLLAANPPAYDALLRTALSLSSVPPSQSHATEPPPAAATALPMGLAKTARKALADALAADPSMRAAAVALPMRRPLLPGARRTLRALVRALPPTSRHTALEAALATWSEPEFVRGADVPLQRQLTRYILYLLRACAAPRRKSKAHGSLAGHVDGDDDADDDADSEGMGYGGNGLMDFARGIQLRLDESDVRMRRFAIVVAEAASRRDAVAQPDLEPLVFDREGMEDAHAGEAQLEKGDIDVGGGDSDFSDLARQVGESLSEDDDNDIDEIDDINASFKGMQVGKANPVHSRKTNDSPEKQKEGSRETCEPADWEALSDDWTSPGSYDLTPSASSGEDSDDDGETAAVAAAAVEKRLGAPDSVPRLLALLRDSNATNDGAPKLTAAEALRAMQLVLSRVQGGGVRAAVRGRRPGADAAVLAAAPELLVEVLRFDPDRYPPEDGPALVKMRVDLALGLLRSDFDKCAVVCVKRVIVGRSADLARREDALRILSDGVTAEEAADREDKEATAVSGGNSLGESDTTSYANGGGGGSERAQIGGARSTHGAVMTVGKVTRRLRSSRAAPRGVATSGGKYLGAFRALVDGLVAGGGADFIDVEGRDVRVWAYAIVIAGSLARAAGAAVCGPAMRTEVLDAGVRRVARLGGEPVARRGVVLAMGAAVDGMSDVEVATLAGIDDNDNNPAAVGGIGSGRGASAVPLRQREIVLLPGRARHGGENDAPHGRVGAAQLGHECVEWLCNAAEGDADIGVRRFAAAVMRRWAARLESVGGAELNAVS